MVKGATDIGFACRYKPEGYSIGVMFPFLMGAPDTATAGRVYEDIWKKFPKVMAEEWKDVKILYLVPSTPAYLFPGNPYGDLRTSRVCKSGCHQRRWPDLMKDLGAAPVFMSPADLAIGLEKGTVDGACFIFNSIADYKLGRKIRYVLMDAWAYRLLLVLIMNKDSFNRLPADLQRVCWIRVVNG